MSIIEDEETTSWELSIRSANGETPENRLQRMRSVATEQLFKDQIPPESAGSFLDNFTRPADAALKATYLNGECQREVDPTAPCPRIELQFLRGTKRHEVNIDEQNKIKQSMPDQLSSAWRLNTAGTLLADFAFGQDLLVTKKDLSEKILDKIRQSKPVGKHGKLVKEQDPESSSTESALITTKKAVVTIDSQQVTIVNEFSGNEHLGSTLIQVDQQSMLTLLFNYRQIVSIKGGDLSGAETLDLLNIMIEDARRLYSRSPRLFHVSTRHKIAKSRNTRYGSDFAGQFVMCTTSQGIKELIMVSSGYFGALRDNPKVQKEVEPKFLQMVILLLSLLNDDDLEEAKPFLESTFGFNADRRHMELAFLKILPLHGVNSFAFLQGVLDAFYEGQPSDKLIASLEGKKDLPKAWENFLLDIFDIGYILPCSATLLEENRKNRQDDQRIHSLADQFANGPLLSEQIIDYSWMPAWPKDGIDSSDIFENLQSAGSTQTINNIPRLRVYSSDSEEELTTVVLNDKKSYLIRGDDESKISSMVPDEYTITTADESKTVMTLRISEKVLSQELLEAIRSSRDLTTIINQQLGPTQRSAGRVKAFSRAVAAVGIGRSSAELVQIQPPPKLSLCTAELYPSQQMRDRRPVTIANTFKINDDMASKPHVIRHFVQNIRALQEWTKRIDEKLKDANRNGASRGSSDETAKQNLADSYALVKEVETQIREAEAMQDVAHKAPNLEADPISKIIRVPKKGGLGLNVWNNYKAELQTQNSAQAHSAKAIFFDAELRSVLDVQPLGTAQLEVSLKDNSTILFMTPLLGSKLDDPESEIAPDDEILLIGNYAMVLALGDTDHDPPSVYGFLRIFDKKQELQAPLKQTGGRRRKAATSLTRRIMKVV